MLIPEDDLPLHQSPEPLARSMGGHPNAYDRFWFNGYREDWYFAVALGLYPNRGVIDAAFSFNDTVTQRSVFSSGPLNGRSSAVGPIRIEIVEPMRVNKITVDAPEQQLRAELTYTARTSAFEEARQTILDGPRTFIDTCRASQLGTWSGWIESAGVRIEVDGAYGTKDRSWGVRPVGEPLPGAPSTRAPQLCFLWAPINFKDTAVHFMSLDESDGRPISRTALEANVDLSVNRGTGQLVASLEPGTRRPSGATLMFNGESIALSPLFTFHMRGAGYQHPTFAHGRWHGGDVVDGEVLVLNDVDPLDFHSLHVQQVVRATWKGQEGIGVLESLIIGPYAPFGLTGLLDGYAN